MLIPNESISMAEWGFEYNDYGYIHFESHSQIYNFLLRCQAAYGILAEAELLYITDILFKNWMSFDPCTKDNTFLAQKNGTGLSRSPYVEPSRLADICLEHIEKEDPLVYPLNINFTGWGIIIDESGEKVKRRSLMKMAVTTMGFPTVEIVTYSDVWLPYDIYAKPQPKLHELNAPRLEKALTEVKEALGVDSIFEGNQLVEQDKEFTLMNYVDGFGDVLSYDHLSMRVL